MTEKQKSNLSVGGLILLAVLSGGGTNLALPSLGLGVSRAEVREVVAEAVAPVRTDIGELGHSIEKVEDQVQTVREDIAALKAITRRGNMTAMATGE